jgi:hypothetical protein
VLSIASGFVRQTYRGNQIDARGSTGAGCLVLVGNHFGLTVDDNHFLGGNDSFKITATPTENPVHWGWSRAPMMGARITRNLLEDSIRGGVIGVEHSAQVKTTRGRVYTSVLLSQNRVRQSPEFLSRFASRNPPGFLIGEARSLDPGEIKLTAEKNTTDSRRRVDLRIVSARVNGQDFRDRVFPLDDAADPASSTGSAGKIPRR